MIVFNRDLSLGKQTIICSTLVAELDYEIKKIKAKNRWLTWLPRCLKRVDTKWTQATDKLSACLTGKKWDCLITEKASNTSAKCMDQEAGRNAWYLLLAVSKEQKQVAESSAHCAISPDCFFYEDQKQVTSCFIFQFLLAEW